MWVDFSVTFGGYFLRGEYVERAELKTQIIETAEFWTTWENDGFNFKLEMEVRDPYTQIMRLTQTCVSDEVEEPEYDLINKLAVGRSSWHKDSLNTAQASLYTESYPLVVEMVKAYNLIRANLVSDL